MLALTGNELRLYVREWGMLVFALVFPPLMMLILAGVFGSEANDEAFPGTNGSDYYIASYVGVPLASVAVTALPVMLASYRELGILRRFAASGVGPLRIVLAQAAVCLVSVLAGAVAVVGLAAPVYGVPEVQRPVALAGVVLLGAAVMLTLGVALGLAVGSVRVANAAGLLVFFPMFILGGGGPPSTVMPSTMRDIAGLLPLTHLTEALRAAWLYDQVPVHEIGWLVGWLVVGLGLVALAGSLRHESGRPRRHVLGGHPHAKGGQLDILQVAGQGTSAENGAAAPYSL
jgi:ABC-2 type transport system permease protein